MSDQLIEVLPHKVFIYDTTLRDGTQMEGINFSLENKLRIAKRLDHMGVHYIEGGWPGSNPKDIRFFEEMKNIRLTQAKLTAFGSTRRAKVAVDKDPNIQALLTAQTGTICIFGKTWDLHVKEALNIFLEENLDLIRDSVAYLKKHNKEVIYDAEHFFDGYKSNQKYALSTLETAMEAGADTIVLCDTNGGSMPQEIEEAIAVVKKVINVPLGIHSHNDSDMAVANTITAVKMGCCHVQGTINGYGERCGNANLCSIISNLKLKLRIDCISDEQLKSITEVSRYVSELANMVPQTHQPFVGASAFAHKGGIHVSAVKKNPLTYEHILPELVGNSRRILISELAGQSSILHKAEEYKITLSKDTEDVRKILKKVKELEDAGYQFEGADASFELLMKKTVGDYKPFFTLKGFRIIVEKKEDEILSEATIKIEVDDEVEYTVAEGDGPVDALDKALREALEGFYPILKGVHLTDYKVRVLDAKDGTAAKVRVLIESSSFNETWGTVGVSENLIEASYQALRDSIEYVLYRKTHPCICRDKSD
ncbi:citramalate synthase [Candidatus Desantisbacteria bacterium]|nr:citramalate synthase [Candidatus Desantisbacteria bacterium]